jgi:chemotaxis signal transduction protein
MDLYGPRIAADPGRTGPAVRSARIAERRQRGDERVAAEAPVNIRAPRPTSSAPDSLLVLTGHVGNLRIAMPVAALERVLPMAMLTPLPEMPPVIVGMLNLHGAGLLVVNPRPLLGLPTPPFRPDQRLIVLRADTRFVLWVDSVERIVDTPFSEAPRCAAPSELPLAPYTVNLEGDTALVLSPEALDPGAGIALPEGAEQT